MCSVYKSVMQQPVTAHTKPQGFPSSKHVAEITRSGIRLPNQSNLVPFEVIQAVMAGLHLPLLVGVGLSNPASVLMVDASESL